MDIDEDSSYLGALTGSVEAKLRQAEDSILELIERETRVAQMYDLHTEALTERFDI